jgi:hypothetical protein
LRSRRSIAVGLPICAAAFHRRSIVGRATETLCAEATDRIGLNSPRRRRTFSIESSRSSQPIVRINGAGGTLMSDDEFEDGPALSHGDLSNDARRLLGLYDVPAFLRRSVRVERAVARIVERCRTAYEAQLDGVRLRLRFWNSSIALTPNGANSARGASFADPTALLVADRLSDRILGDRRTVARGARAPAPRSAWLDLQASVDRFNGRWRTFVTTIDLGEVNRLIDGYNRNYLVEKECVMSSVKLAHRGFTPMNHLTTDWIFERFPLIDFAGRRSSRSKDH